MNDITLTGTINRTLREASKGGDVEARRAWRILNGYPGDLPTYTKRLTLHDLNRGREEHKQD